MKPACAPVPKDAILATMQATSEQDGPSGIALPDGNEAQPIEEAKADGDEPSSTAPPHGDEAQPVEGAKADGDEAQPVERAKAGLTAGAIDDVVASAMTDPWYERWSYDLSTLPLEALPTPRDNHGDKTYKLHGKAATITVRLDKKIWYVKPVPATRIPDSLLEEHKVRRDQSNGVSVSWTKHGVSSWGLAKMLADM